MPVQLDPRTHAIVVSLSPPRLGSYLAATGNNVKGALRLYRWNIDMSGAVYEALHVVEVVLRNALDAQISQWNATQINVATGTVHSTDWLMDPSHLLRRLAGRDIDNAADHARKALKTGNRRGRSPRHPDVLAQLSFGTWRFLLPDNDPGRLLLWTDALHRAFPHLTITPSQLVAQVAGLHRLRNRVAHLEPLLQPDLLEEEFKAMLGVLSAIDPVMATWFTSLQRVTITLRARPS